jgi:osmotically-inducible protein OsmY
MKNFILVASFCLLSSACSSMLLGGSATGNPSLGHDPRTAQQLSDDNAITSSIKTRYHVDSVIGKASVGVATYMGTVTLSGTVGSFDVRDRAVSIARNTDKVGSVNNQILVNSSR